jgi:hypothetical protein
VEFITKPLGRTAVRHAVNALWPYFAEGRMRPSVRTGIHIHASCLGLNTDHVIRVLRHYALVEPILFDYVGAEREENIYCIPWYRSPSEAETAYQWIRSYEPNLTGEMRGVEEPCKYSAMYVGPLTNFGTIEFRHAPTWTDAETMFRWWQLVQALWRTHETDYNVLDRFSELGPVGFARSIFPFDWLKEPTEQMFEDADVETVCSLLDEPRIITSTDWGRAPELAGPGVAAAVPPRPIRNRLLDQTEDGDLGRTFSVRGPPDMTLADFAREQQEMQRQMQAAAARLRTTRGLAVNVTADPEPEEPDDIYSDDDEEQEF